MARGVRRGLVALVVCCLVVAGAVAAWVYLSGGSRSPGCTVGPAVATPEQSDDTSGTFRLTPEQAGNAATIAAVGMRVGMPHHAVTVALATALQESGLRNLHSGDRDSAGLFQQRPSQGWGTLTQIRDPVHAATVFYDRLREVPGWRQLSVTQAAQHVQRSAAPDAYAMWEQEARAAAVALTGEKPRRLTCHDLAISATGVDVADVAESELGTRRLSGPHDSSQGWAIGSWLVAHAAGFGIDRVSFDGSTWTAESGVWQRTGALNGVLRLHQVEAQGP